MTLRLTILLLIVSLAGCATHKITDSAGYWNEENGKSVRLKILDLKEKNTIADITVTVENRYPFSIVIPENSIHFEINGERATGNTNPHWILKAGDVVRANRMKLKYQSRGQGPATLSVDYIYQGEEVVTSGSNSSRESQTRSRVVSGSAPGVSNSNSTARTQGFITKSSVEGKQLQGLTIQIP